MRYTQPSTTSPQSVEQIYRPAPNEGKGDIIIIYDSVMWILQNKNINAKKPKPKSQTLHGDFLVSSIVNWKLNKTHETESLSRRKSDWLQYGQVLTILNSTSYVLVTEIAEELSVQTWFLLPMSESLYCHQDALHAIILENWIGPFAVVVPSQHSHR